MKPLHQTVTEKLAAIEAERDQLREERDRMSAALLDAGRELRGYRAALEEVQELTHHEPSRVVASIARVCRDTLRDDPTEAPMHGANVIERRPVDPTEAPKEDR